MSIADKITALQNASSAIASAIAAKGVTVPSGSGYEDYATLIGNIQTGGGGATLVPTAGDYPVVANGGLGGGGNNLTSTGISVTIPVSGTYRFKWCAFRRNNSTSYTWGSQLYRKRGSSAAAAVGTENTTWTSTYIQSNSLDLACNAGDIIYVYVRGRSSSYSWGGYLMACVNQKMWTNE